ncbi:MAG: hypothetical protein AB1426_12815 [Bacillota bacterium]
MNDKTITGVFAAAVGLGVLYLLARPAQAAPGQPGTEQPEPQVITVEYTVSGRGCC